MTKNQQGQLLPFERSGAQVRNLAERQWEQGQYLTALELLRPSMEKDRDPQTVLMIAEIYAEMGCWTLSNEAFFTLVHIDEYAAQCFFGLGFNLYKMQEYTVARDCFMLALEKDPEGLYAPDAAELLDTIEEASEPLDPLDTRMQRRMARVLDALDQGKAGLAKRQIRRVLPLNKRRGGIRSLQAFAMLAGGDAKAALDAARKSLHAAPHDVRSLCAMASALKANRSMQAAHAYLQRAMDQIAQEDDFRLVCQTACEMGAHSFVISMLLPAESQSPYQEELLRPLAIALHNAGHTEEAVRRWSLLHRMDPDDTVAGYWLGMWERSKLPELIPYDQPIPLEEILWRLKHLGEWMHEGREAMLTRWREDSLLPALLRWGLSCGEAGIPRVACNILSTIDDPGAQVLLRHTLCDVNASTELKQSVLATLYAMGAEGPLYAIVEDRLTLVHVSRVTATDQAQGTVNAQTLYEQASRWLSLSGEEAQAQLRQLCELASGVAYGALEAEGRARAAVLAYCFKAGIQTPFSSTMPSRRRIERCARQILKEAEHAVPEL